MVGQGIKVMMSTAELYRTAEKRLGKARESRAESQCELQRAEVKAAGARRWHEQRVWAERVRAGWGVEAQCAQAKHDLNGYYDAHGVGAGSTDQALADLKASAAALKVERVGSNDG